MISKMNPTLMGGSRIAIVFNGSPLFSGAAGSGESEIRRWIIENDWLEAVVALPDQLFYNTGIFTYFWVLTNRKSEQRQGKVQLIDCRDFSVPMWKSLGDKRKKISEDQIAEITRLYTEFTESEKVKILGNSEFGYLRVNIDRPLRAKWSVGLMKRALNHGDEADRIDETQREALLSIAGEPIFDSDTEFRKFIRDVVYKIPTKALNAAVKIAMIRDPSFEIVTDKRGKPKRDQTLADQELIPLPRENVSWDQDISHRVSSEGYKAAIRNYVEREVLPHVTDAWADFSKTKIGYEVPLTRHFYDYTPPRDLSDINTDIANVRADIDALTRDMSA